MEKIMNDINNLNHHLLSNLNKNNEQVASPSIKTTTTVVTTENPKFEQQSIANEPPVTASFTSSNMVIKQDSKNSGMVKPRVDFSLAAQNNDSSQFASNTNSINSFTVGSSVPPPAPPPPPSFIFKSNTILNPAIASNTTNDKPILAHSRLKDIVIHSTNDYYNQFNASVLSNSNNNININSNDTNMMNSFNKSNFNTAVDSINLINGNIFNSFLSF
jgi:hypothetical protein